MIDDEEAELRKEQLRLQNLALATQLADRVRAERRQEAAKQLAKDVGKAGVAVAKLVAIGAAILAGLVAILLLNAWHKESVEADQKRADELAEAQAECRKSDGTTRIFLTLPDGTHGSVQYDELLKMPHGTRRGKKCSEILDGEYPY